MASPLIVEERFEKVVVVKINRPKAHNALNLPTLLMLEQKIKEFEQDENASVIIITGVGEKAFVAGADVQSLNKYTTAEIFRGDIQRVFTNIEQCRKPVIAAVNGYALGGGCELALACDIRLASRNAKFGQPEVGLGVLPGAGGTQRLAKLIGLGRAKELILTGRLISAEEAERYGLVTKVVDEGQVLLAALEVAHTILSKGQVAVQLAKLALNCSLNTDSATGQLVEKLAQSILFTTEDRIEGTQAFLDKRKPNFTGRW